MGEILKRIFNKYGVIVWTGQWIHLAQGGVQWRAFLNAVMNLWFENRREISWLYDSQKGTSYME
jgi:hypothetical protein